MSVGGRRHGAIVDNIVTNLCAKLIDNDRLWNEKALADRKSDNNKNPKKKKNVRSAWRPVSGSRNIRRKILNNYRIIVQTDGEIFFGHHANRKRKSVAEIYFRMATLYEMYKNAQTNIVLNVFNIGNIISLWISRTKLGDELLL